MTQRKDVRDEEEGKTRDRPLLRESGVPRGSDWRSSIWTLFRVGWPVGWGHYVSPRITGIEPTPSGVEVEEESVSVYLVSSFTGSEPSDHAGDGDIPK